MTFRKQSLFHLFIGLAAGGTVLLVWAAASVDAPGPPPLVIEPQTGMVLVAIEPGTFLMGTPTHEPGRDDDETRHAVSLTRRIYMGRHEVTQAEWAHIMRRNPSARSGCGLCPVEHVDFFEVDQFITNLNAQSTALRYRLPTEAEWEYACRAGTLTAESPDSRQAAEKGSGAVSSTQPSGRVPPVRAVGHEPPNVWGLSDMQGNVWEWTNDWYGPYPEEAVTNPVGAEAGRSRVIRGGWAADTGIARCGDRDTLVPQDKGSSVGFRIVAEPIVRRGGDRDADAYLNR